MPVLPLVASSKCLPASKPWASAAATIADAARSLTDPPGFDPFSLAQQADSREMGSQSIEAQERRVSYPFQDATAQDTKRRAHFSLHFGLHEKSLIQLI